jgi:hypothetical protein
MNQVWNAKSVKEKVTQSPSAPSTKALKVTQFLFQQLFSASYSHYSLFLIRAFFNSLRSNCLYVKLFCKSLCG